MRSITCFCGLLHLLISFYDLVYFSLVISILVCERNTTTVSAMEEMEEELLDAAKEGRTSEVKQLIEKGVDVNTRGWEVRMHVTGG